jgi:hypothetical protein
VCVQCAQCVHTANKVCTVCTVCTGTGIADDQQMDARSILPCFNVLQFYACWIAWQCLPGLAACNTFCQRRQPGQLGKSWKDSYSFPCMLFTLVSSPLLGQCLCNHMILLQTRTMISYRIEAYATGLYYTLKLAFV